MKIMTLCKECADDLYIAYAGHSKMKIQYKNKATEGKCENCKRMFRAGLAMYEVIQK